jgi:hypothetical protein
VLGNHYKTVQWFPLACYVPTEVSPPPWASHPPGSPLLCLVGSSHRNFSHTIPQFCHHSFTEHPSGLPSQLPRTAGWYAKTRLYHILCLAIPIWAHGCTIFIDGRSMNRSLDLGMITNHRPPASHRTKPWTVGITPTSSIPVTQNPILHTNSINITVTAIRVTKKWCNIIIPKSRPGHARLSSSKPMTTTQYFYGFQGIINQY